MKYCACAYWIEVADIILWDVCCLSSYSAHTFTIVLALLLRHADDNGRVKIKEAKVLTIAETYFTL